MPNEEQVKILKRGVETWNKWRKENPSVEIDLFMADLNGLNLQGVDFSHANLSISDLSLTDLSSANLAYGNLIGANLISTNFNNANLESSNLMTTTINRTKLLNTNLINASFGQGIISFTNLSSIKWLEKTHHLSPTTIGTDTINLSKGNIPEVFLQGCGLNDWEIASAKLYKPGLSNKEIDEILYKIHDLRAQQSIQISPLFISYSHADTSFVEKLEEYLLEKGVRSWRDVHNATAGRLETQINRAMRQNPTVLLILSKNSTASDWVEHEARLARQLEKEIDKEVLCPIALDDSWKTAKWPARLMEQIMEYNILDFSKWEDNRAFEEVFYKMINGLDMFYKPDKESSR